MSEWVNGGILKWEVRSAKWEVTAFQGKTE